MDFDATITIAHSEKENAAATWKRTFGFHPLLCFLDRPDIAAGEALAGLLRPGNAGSNTAADHITVLDMALAALPEHARPWLDPEHRHLGGPTAAGPLGFRGRDPCVRRGLRRARGRVLLRIPRRCADPARSSTSSPNSVGTPPCRPRTVTGNEFRDGAWVAEATGMIDLTGWPAGSRLILRKERPHPGAQLTFADVDGHRVTAILTNTPAGIVPGQAAGLELRHRQHARVEDRIREAKATGLRNLPSKTPRPVPIASKC